MQSQDLTMLIFYRFTYLYITLTLPHKTKHAMAKLTNLDLLIASLCKSRPEQLSTITSKAGPLHFALYINVSWVDLYWDDRLYLDKLAWAKLASRHRGRLSPRFYSVMTYLQNFTAHFTHTHLIASSVWTPKLYNHMQSHHSSTQLYVRHVEVESVLGRCCGC